jgi:photosystem II stability/assembly factor-like uncharacterized protein
MIHARGQRPTLRLVAALCAACSLATAADAQPVDPALLAAMQWRMIGPHRGGRVLAVAGVPGQPNLYYFGAVGGGVWKTSNVGETWEPIFDGQPVASIGALAVAPSDPNVIYVGTGEADMRSDISFGDGMYRSADGGRTWRNIGLRDSRHIGRILVDPRNAQRLLVAALGHAYGPNAERGVFLSTDGGTTWEKVLYRDADTGAIDLSADPEHPEVVYAALWQARRMPWSSYPAMSGPGGGLYRSTDGGRTWNGVRGHGLPDGTLGRIGIAVVRGGSRIYALIDARDGGLYRSDDAGASWRRVNADPRLWGRGWYFGGVTVDPAEPDTVYVGNVALYRSTDGGGHFVPIKGAPGGDDYHALWIDPSDSRRMILGCDQGAIISVDGGGTWSSWFNQPTAQFYHVATDRQFPYYVYGAQQDSGTAAVASRGDFGSITFRDWFSVGAGESGYLVPSPADPGIVYGGDTYGALWRFDRRTGQAQNISPVPWVDFGADITTRKYRFTWTSPLAVSPQDPHTLYFGSQYLLRTTDEGKHWDEISPDLTGTAPAAVKAAAGEPLTPSTAKARGAGVIYSIAPSPLRAGLIWVGTDTGLVHLTRDAGATWTDVTPPGIGELSRFSLIDASPHDAATAYAAVDRHRLDDYGPHVFRTHDFGVTWREISTGIAPTAYVHAVREDPRRKGLLFAGTELGVYLSFDDGDHWQPLQLNLPVTPVHDLVVHDDDVVVATHGRSFWILDDIAPLRQITPAISSSGAHLFAPSTAVRVRRSVNADTPLSPEVPAGANPPSGAILDYFLQAEPAGEITIEIYRADGILVRRFSSADTPFEPPRPPAIERGWFRPAPPMQRSPGMHRFVWNLRYAPPPLLEPDYSMSVAYGMDTPPVPEATLVLPGKYEVRLTVAGQTLRQPLDVRMDPRVDTSPEDLAAMHDLSRRIAEALEQSAGACRSVRRLRERLEERRKTLPGTPQSDDVAKALADLAQRATQLADAGPGSASSEIGLAPTHLALAGLATAVESADRGPTAQALAFYQQRRTDLDHGLARWEDLRTKDLVALNALLRSRHLAEIQGP